MDDHSLYQVIKSKIVDYVEIVVLFTEHCNLKCVFCPQDHDDITGADYDSIISKAHQIVKYINSNPKKDFVIHAMGGELFQDLFLEQNLTVAYGDFIEYIRNNIDPDKTVNFLFVTNLVYEGIEQVKGFCRKYDLKMNVSYDPTGRFNERDFELYKQNIELFKPYIHLISLVITKPSIDKMLAGDEYFDYLYSNFTCDWDQVLPGQNFNAALMPSESELFNFYKLLVDRYPKCNNIKYFTEKRQQAKMSCTRGSSHTILTDGSSPRGCSGTALLKDNTTEDLGSTKIIEIFLEQNECLTCEYFSRCSFTCFIKNDYKHINRDMGKCVFKEVYKYVESKCE